MTDPSGGAVVLPPPARTGRAAELGMLVFAGVIVTAALVIVELNQGQTLRLDLLWYGAAYLAVFAIAHLITRRLAPYADPLLLPLVALLNGIGLVMIYRLDLINLATDPTSSRLAPLQLLWTGISLVLFLLVLLIIRDHTVLQHYGYTLALVGVIFLCVPAVLPKRFSEVNGAQIWIKIPHLISIQPGEFAKIALIAFAAAFLVAKRTVLSIAGRRILGLTLPRVRDLAPLLLAVLAAVGVLIFSNDLGTAMLIFGVLLTMVYLATGRVSWLIIGLLGFAGGAVLAYRFVPHLQVRVDIWLHPFADPQNTGYQVVQSLFGLGAGGLFGTGLGAGRPDLIPEAYSDFITAALGEELGLVGLAALLLCYLLLTARGLRTAMAVKDQFGSLLAAGLSFAIALQVFVIVGGVTRLIPLTGLTTPFLSYGGSSLLANYIILALLLRISDSARRPVLPKPRRVTLTEARTELLPVGPNPAETDPGGDA